MPKMVILPSGEDPDTFVRKSGAEAMHQLAAEALTLGEWVVDRVILEAGPGASSAVIAMRELKPLLKQVHDPVELALYLRRMAQRLSVDESVLRASLTDKKEMRVATSAVTRADTWEAHSIAQRIMRLVLQYPMVWSDVSDRLMMIDFDDDESRTILHTICEFTNQPHSGGEGKAPPALPVEGATRAPVITLSVGRLVENLVDKELCGMVEEMALSEPECDEEEALAVTRAYLDVLDRRHHKGQLHQLNQEIAEAQLSGNESRLMELLTQKQNLVRTTTWQRPMPKPN
jgi:DNA primase